MKINNQNFIKKYGKSCCVLFLIFVFLTFPVSASPDDSVDFSDYKNKTIAVSTGSVQEQYVKTLIPDANIAYYDSPADMIIALQQHKIDAFATTYLAILSMFKTHPDLICDERILGSDKACFAFSPTAKGEKYQREFNEFLAEATSSYLEERNDFYLNCDDEDLPVIDFSGLKGPNGTIRFGTSSGAYPFCTLTGKGLQGIDLELLYNFGEKYGYRFEIEDTAFPSVLAGVSTGVYDMGGGGIAYTEERAKSVRLSEGYFYSDQVLVLLASNSGTSEISQEITGFSFWEKIKNSVYNTFIKEDRWKLIVIGFKNTLFVTLGALFLGTIFSIAVTWMMCSKSLILRKVAGVYHYIMQGMPMVVVLMMLYYVVFSRIVVAPLLVAILGFALNSASGIAESFYGSICSVDKGEREASLALGFTEKETFWGIVFPQALQRTLPAYRSQIISILKGTAIVGYIAVQDITKVADIIRSRSFDAFFPLLLTSLVYFILAYFVRTLFSKILKKTDHTGKRRIIKGVD